VCAASALVSQKVFALAKPVPSVYWEGSALVPRPMLAALGTYARLITSSFSGHNAGRRVG
jgi:hypothetical protein